MPANAPPVVTVPASISLTEDISTSLTGVSFSDIDAGGGSVTAMFSVPAGALSATSGGGVTVGGTATALTLTGAIADINAFIAAGNVGYTPAANATGTSTLTVSINDAGLTGDDGPKTDSEAVGLTINAVNDTPEISAPEGIRLPGSATTAITGLSFSDADAGSGTVTVSLEVSGGPLPALLANSTPDVTADISGAILSLTGSVSAINAYIAAGEVTFSAPVGFTGEGTLVVGIDDLGNTGSGGGKTAETTIALDIGGTNTLPSGAVTISGAAEIGAVLTADVDITDPDGPGDYYYQWFADGAPIAGADEATFTLTSGLAGRTITVEVSYTDLFGVEERVASDGLAIPGGPGPGPEPKPEPPETVFFGEVPAIIERFLGPGLTPFQTVTISPASIPADAPVNVPFLQQFDALKAQLSQGWGLKATGPDSLKSGAAFWNIAGPALGLDPAEETTKRIEEVLRRALDPSAGMDPEREIATQKLTPELLEGFNPKSPLVISGGATKNDPFTAVTIDTSMLEKMADQMQSALDAAIALQNIHLAIIQGMARIIGGAGPQIVLGDDAVQHIVLGEGDDELYGGGGNDTVGSATGNDSVSGDEGSDSVFGGEGDDQVLGGADADTAQGNTGADLVHGNQGDDLLYGGQGEDIVRGGQGNDLAFGDLGNDLVFGDLGDDRLEGGGGNDTLQGNQGSDTILGGAGADFIHGGQGNDVLEGGEGDDTLSGDFGDDVLTGGAGADTFLLLPGRGLDRVTDFTAADQVVLAPDVAFSLRQAGADTVIDLGDLGRMTLTGVQYADLPEGWLTVA